MPSPSCRLPPVRSPVAMMAPVRAHRIGPAAQDHGAPVRPPALHFRVAGRDQADSAAGEGAAPPGDETIAAVVAAIEVAGQQGECRVDGDHGMPCECGPGNPHQRVPAPVKAKLHAFQEERPGFGSDPSWIFLRVASQTQGAKRPEAGGDAVPRRLPEPARQVGRECAASGRFTRRCHTHVSRCRRETGPGSLA